MAISVNGERSRRLSRPAVWSISAPVSTTASIGLPRLPPRGCSARRRLDLRAQIGRGVEQRPALAVGRHGEARLRARTHARVAGPGEPADIAVTIPLRKAAARRRTEHDGGQTHLGGKRKRDQNSAGR